MGTLTNIISAAVAVVTGLLGSTGTLGAQAAKPEMITPPPVLTPALQPCVATISQPIVAGTANQEITVSVSEDLMDSVSVDVAPQSNLKVSNITRDPGSKLVKLQVDATNGAPGTWSLTLNGKNTSCKGQVKVSAHS